MKAKIRIVSFLLLLCLCVSLSCSCTKKGKPFICDIAEENAIALIDLTKGFTNGKAVSSDAAVVGTVENGTLYDVTVTVEADSADGTEHGTITMVLSYRYFSVKDMDFLGIDAFTINDDWTKI